MGRCLAFGLGLGGGWLGLHFADFASQVVDMLGQRTEIAFSGWKKNPAFAEGTFRYTPAEGVDVVDAG